MWIPLPLLGVPPWMVFISFSISLALPVLDHTERIRQAAPGVRVRLPTPHRTTGCSMDRDTSRQELTAASDHLGPAVRQLPAGTFRPLQADQAVGRLQHLGWRPTVRGDRPRRPDAATAGATGSATIFGPPGWGSRRLRPPPGLIRRRMAAMESRILLPGVGLRYEFENHDGTGLGVVARRARGEWCSTPPPTPSGRFRSGGRGRRAHRRHARASSSSSPT